MDATFSRLTMTGASAMLLLALALMMALMCYVYANYAAIVTGHLVRLVAGG